MKVADRQQAIRRLIPEQPAFCTAASLRDVLIRDGVEVTSRTVQRDLIEVGRDANLVCSPGKPQQWSWKPGRKHAPTNKLTPETALALVLFGDQLKTLMPVALHAALEPFLERAQSTLNAGPPTLRRWRERVTVHDSSMPYLLPDLAPGVLAAVQEALGAGKRLKIDYRVPKGTIKRYELHPHGLVLTEGALYLVALPDRTISLRQFALHRVLVAEPSTLTSILIPGFDIRAYAREEIGIHYSVGRHLKIRLRVWDFLVSFLRERPVSPVQKITPHRDGSATVAFEMADTGRLRAWLRSHGPIIEVLAPKSLRDAIAKDLAHAARAYRRVTQKPTRTPSG